MYATSGGNNYSRDLCLNKSIVSTAINGWANDYSECVTNDWIANFYNKGFFMDHAPVLYSNSRQFIQSSENKSLIFSIILFS